MNFKSDGIVLSRKSFQEADRLVTFYTRDYGKITCIAKGVKKPKSRKAGHLEPATYCTLYVAKGKNLDILTEVETKKAFGLESLPEEKTNRIYHLLELVDHLTPHNQKNVDVFNLLVSFLKTLKENNNDELLLAAFKIKLLSLLGFFSSKNLKDSKSKELLFTFESQSIFTLQKQFNHDSKYLKLLSFLDSIIEKITERKLKTSRFIHAQI